MLSGSHATPTKRGSDDLLNARPPKRARATAATVAYLSTTAFAGMNVCSSSNGCGLSKRDIEFAVFQKGKAPLPGATWYLKNCCNACGSLAAMANKARRVIENAANEKMKDLYHGSLQRANRNVDGSVPARSIRIGNLEQLPHDVKPDWMWKHHKTIAGRCEITGVPYDIASKVDFMLSMNQLVPNQGYTMGTATTVRNCEFTLNEANLPSYGGVQFRQAGWTELINNFLEFTSRSHDAAAASAVAFATAAQMVKLTTMKSSGELRNIVAIIVRRCSIHDEQSRGEGSSANNISVDEAIEKLFKQKGRCKYTFMILSLTLGTFFTFSLERINNDLPHTKNNTVWVVVVMNCAGNTQADQGIGMSRKKFVYLVLKQNLVVLTKVARERLDEWYAQEA